MQWIVVLVIIVIAVVSAIAQTIKNQQEKEQTPRRRPTRTNKPEGVRTGASDMDRFLQEIEKLRKRSADGGDEPKKPQRTAKVPKPVPTVVPAKRPKRSEPVPTVAPVPRVDRLPTATVLAPPQLPEDNAITRSGPQFSDAPAVSKRPAPVPTSAFGHSLLATLGNKQSVPLAIVLNEVLGPPKCKQ